MVKDEEVEEDMIADFACDKVEIKEEKREAQPTKSPINNMKIEIKDIVKDISNKFKRISNLSPLTPIDKDKLTLRIPIKESEIENNGNAYEAESQHFSSQESDSNHRQFEIDQDHRKNELSEIVKIHPKQPAIPNNQIESMTDEIEDEIQKYQVNEEEEGDDDEDNDDEEEEGESEDESNKYSGFREKQKHKCDSRFWRLMGEEVNQFVFEANAGIKQNSIRLSLVPQEKPIIPIPKIRYHITDTDSWPRHLQEKFFVLAGRKDGKHRNRNLDSDKNSRNREKLNSNDRNGSSKSKSRSSSVSRILVCQENNSKENENSQACDLRGKDRKLDDKCYEIQGVQDDVSSQKRKRSASVASMSDCEGLLSVKKTKDQPSETVALNATQPQSTQGKALNQHKSNIDSKSVYHSGISSTPSPLVTSPNLPPRHNCRTPTSPIGLTSRRTDVILTKEQLQEMYTKSRDDAKSLKKQAQSIQKTNYQFYHDIILSGVKFIKAASFLQMKFESEGDAKIKSIEQRNLIEFIIGTKNFFETSQKHCENNDILLFHKLFCLQCSIFCAVFEAQFESRQSFRDVRLSVKEAEESENKQMTISVGRVKQLLNISTVLNQLNRLKLAYETAIQSLSAGQSTLFSVLDSLVREACIEDLNALKIDFGRPLDISTYADMLEKTFVKLHNIITPLWHS